MTAKAVFVAGICGRNAKQILMLMYCADNCTKEHKELCVVLWGFARFKKIFAGVCGK